MILFGGKIHNYLCVKIVGVGQSILVATYINPLISTIYTYFVHSFFILMSD